MRLYDFPGRGVGAFVALGPDATIAQAGLFLIGLDGADLNLQVIPKGNGAFDLFRRVGKPWNGEQWPNASDRRKLVGTGDLKLDEEAGTLTLDLILQRADIGAPEVTVSPPPPPTVRVQLVGRRFV